VLRKIAFEDPQSPRKANRHIPIELETIVMKSIAKNPDDRYQTAHELAADLRHFQNDEPIEARPATPVQRTVKWLRNHPATVISGSSIAIALLIAAVSLSFVLAAQVKQKGQEVVEERARGDALAESLDKSEGLRLAALAALELPNDPEVAVQLGIRAFEQYPSLEANNVLLQALDDNHHLNSLAVHSKGVGSVEFGENGSTLLVTPPRTAFRTSSRLSAAIWKDVDKPRQATLRTTFELDPLPVGFKSILKATSAAFLPSGGRVITANSAGTLASANGVPEKARHRRQNLLTGAPIIWDELNEIEPKELAGAYLFHADRSAFNARGDLVVSPANGNTAKVFDVLSGRSIATLTGHERRIVFAAFAPTENSIITASEDNTLRIWQKGEGDKGWSHVTIDFREEAERPRGRYAGAFVLRAAFSPDSSKLVISTDDNRLQIWEISDKPRKVDDWAGHRGYFVGDDVVFERGDETFVWRESDPAAAPMAFAGTGAVVSRDREVIVTLDGTRANISHFRSGELIGQLKGHRDDITSLAISPNSQLIATGSKDGTARVWHVLPGNRRAEYDVLVPGERRTAMATSDDSQLVAVSAEAEFVTSIWDSEENRVIGVVPGKRNCPVRAANRFVTLAGNRVTVYSPQTAEEVASSIQVDSTPRLAMASPDGELVAIADEQGALDLWDVSANERVRLREEGDIVVAMDFHPTLPQFTTIAGKSVRVWNTETKELQRQFDFSGICGTVTYGRTGKWLAATLQAGAVTVWSVPDWQVKRRFESENALDDAVISHDETAVFGFHRSQDSTVYCWSVETGEVIGKLDSIKGSKTVRASPNRMEVAISSAQGVQFWNPENGELRPVTQAPTDLCRYDATGGRLITSRSTTLRQPPAFAAKDLQSPLVEIWDAGDGERQDEIGSVEGPLQSVGVLADRLLLTEYRYGVKVFDIATGEQHSLIQGHGAPLSAIGFRLGGDDEAALATASWDTNAAIWNLKDGRRVVLFDKHQSAIVAGALSSETGMLATADNLGVVRRPRRDQKMRRKLSPRTAWPAMDGTIRTLLLEILRRPLKMQSADCCRKLQPLVASRLEHSSSTNVPTDIGFARRKSAVFRPMAEHFATCKLWESVIRVKPLKRRWRPLSRASFCRATPREGRPIPAANRPAARRESCRSQRL
jgi:WD40 repeat protein